MSHSPSTVFRKTCCEGGQLSATASSQSRTTVLSLRRTDSASTSSHGLLRRSRNSERVMALPVGSHRWESTCVQPLVCQLVCQLAPSDREMRDSLGNLVSLNFGSWNRMVEWLKHIDALRRAA